MYTKRRGTTPKGWAARRGGITCAKAGEKVWSVKQGIVGKGQGMGKRGGVGHNTGIPKMINRKVPPLLAPYPKKAMSESLALGNPRPPVTKKASWDMRSVSNRSALLTKPDKVRSLDSDIAAVLRPWDHDHGTIKLAIGLRHMAIPSRPTNH